MRSQGYITDYKKKTLTSGDGMEILNANSFPGFGIKKKCHPYSTVFDLWLCTEI